MLSLVNGTKHCYNSTLAGLFGCECGQFQAATGTVFRSFVFLFIKVRYYIEEAVITHKKALKTNKKHNIGSLYADGIKFVEA